MHVFLAWLSPRPCWSSTPGEAIIAIVDELEQAGRLDNTYIFVLSDNGWMAGHLNWRVKQVPYDRSIRVEMRAWGPGFAAGVDERMVATIDIAPTVSPW